MYNILIVEDDEAISAILVNKLNNWGYNVSSVKDFKDVLSFFNLFRPHLVLMDINLPYFDGFYWCSRIREFSHVPVIFISSRDTDADKIRAISQGGDDFVEKPFSLDLLIVKIQASLRRTYSYSDNTLNILQYKDLLVDAERYKAINGRDETELTKNECRIISLLVSNQGKVVSRTRLIKALWDDESFVDDNTLTVNMNRLRKKIDGIGLSGYIKTVKGKGYCLS